VTQQFCKQALTAELASISQDSRNVVEALGDNAPPHPSTTLLANNQTGLRQDACVMGDCWLRRTSSPSTSFAKRCS